MTNKIYVPRSCLGNNSAEISKLISAHDNLRICFDTNHLLNENITDFINERHWLPGEGKINWNKIIKALEAVGYNGYRLYEIGFEAPWSIERSRDLNCYDFKTNFTEIMKKKTLTKTGEPKKNLGMLDFIK